MPFEMPILNELFSAEWQNALASVPESGMRAKGTFKLRTGKPVYDPNTNKTEAPMKTLYTGKMRVQPLRSAGLRPMANDTTSVQTFLVSIPIKTSTSEIVVGTQVRITESPLNTDLLNYPLIVSEVSDSSNPLERTYLCTFDQEQRV